MTVPLTQVYADVRVQMNASIETPPLLSSDHEPPTVLNRLIRGALLTSWRELLLARPQDATDVALPLEGDIHWMGRPGHGAGWMALPADYLTLVTFRMNDWHRAATIVSAGSNAHARQQSRVAAIHGNPWRPVVVTGPSAFGQRLTFYTSQGGNRAALTEALYLPLPRVETDIHGCEVARLPRLLYDDIVLSTAQRTLDILRQ